MAAFAYILSDIRTAARDLLNEATASFWSDADLNNYINDGLREVAEIAGCIQNTDDKVTVAAARTVSYSGYDVVNVEYIPATGRGLSLVQSDPLQNSQTSGVEPQRWWTGNNVFGIEPTPDAIYNLKAYVSDVGAELTSDGHTPLIPLAFRPLLVWYTCYRAFLREQNYGVASVYHQLYQSELIFTAQNILGNMPTARTEQKYL